MMHRVSCAAMTAASILLAVGPSLAQTPSTEASRPPIETTKVEGTDNVYIFRNGNHQSMFVVTKNGVIATDPIAYGRPTGGQAYVGEIRKVTNLPIKYLIYSHHHFDHIAGGKAFKDAGATIIAHRRVRERLAVIKDPFTVPPDGTFEMRKIVKLGDTTLELLYLGRNHSDSNIVMRLPKEKLIFLVDTIPVGAMPGLGMIDMYPLEAEAFIERVIGLDWERMIPGHPGQPGGRLGTKDDARKILALMREASAEIKKLAREGKCWQPAERDFKMPQYASWPNYENGLPYIARRYCSLWGRGT